MSLVTTRLRFIEPQLGYLGRAVARGQALTLMEKPDRLCFEEIGEIIELLVESEARSRRKRA
jgi:hypothetical protein